MDPYIIAFHDLGGHTIGEHKKNFNSYLSSLRALPAEQANQIIEHLNPTTLQEEIFNAKIQITFKFNEKLLETFYKGNIILNKIIINIAFDDLFGAMDADTFTEKVCPNISAVMRIKIINKLARKIADPCVGDSFHAKILGRYGLKAAENLLVCCSEEVLRENRARFTFKKLIRLHKRYPKFLKFYLEKEKTRVIGIEEIARYLSVNDVHWFYENFVYFSEVKIGRKGFKNFLNHYKRELLEDPVKYFKIFHSKILIRRLTRDECGILITNLLPQKKHNFNYYGKAYCCLKMLPLNIRGDIFFNAYKEKYGCEVFEEEEMPPYTFISTFPLDYRLKFGLSEEEHFPLLQTKDSITKIKALIVQTIDYIRRKNLLLQLLEACKVNHDFDALAEVLNYINKRHVNELPQTRTSVLLYLLENFKLEHLKQKHWDLISEFLDIFHVRVERPDVYQRMIGKRIHFKLLNGIDCEKDLNLIFNKFNLNVLVVERRAVGSYNLLKHRPDFEKYCLNQISKSITSKPASVVFCKSVYNYNMRNKKLRINYFDYPTILNNYMDTLLLDAAGYCAKPFDFKRIKIYNTQHDQEIICDILLMNVSNPEHVPIQADYRKKYYEGSFYLPRKISVWLLNNKPDFIEANLPKCIHYYKPYEIELMRFSKIYPKIDEYYLEQFHLNQDVAAALNFFSYTNNFIEFSKKFNPLPGCGINFQNSDTKRVLDIQRSILSSIKYTPLPQNYLKIILNYTNRDYLQFALQPLYSACFHIPENHLHVPLTILLDLSVSVRKHAIHLTLALLPVNSITTFLSNALESERNPSLRKFVTKSCHKFFICNPSDQTMQLLKNCLNHQADDPEIRSLLYNVERISDKYLPDYIKLIWYIFENKDLRILREIDSEVILKLDNAFCDQLLTKSIFYEGVDTKNFICNYLYHAGEFLQHRVTTFCDCITTYINNADDFQKLTQLKGNAYLLLESINIFMVRQKSVITVKTLQQSFKNIAVPHGKFLYEMLFDTTLFFMNNEGKALGKFIYDYSLILIDNYGSEVFDYYKEFVQHYLKNLFFTLPGSVSRHFLLLVEELLEMQDCLRAQLLAVSLLPNCVTEGSEEMERFNVLVDKLVGSDSPIVVLYLERRLRGF